MKLLPFDLKRAQAGEPIYVREGVPAKLITHIPDADARQRVVVKIGDRVRLFDEKGKEAPSRGRPVTLYMGPRITWVNLYKGKQDNQVEGKRFESEADAKAEATGKEVVLAQMVELVD